MKKELLIGIAVVVGAMALFAGASVSTVIIGAMVLACPLMMMFMGHGTNGSHSAQAEHREDDSSSDLAGTKR